MQQKKTWRQVAEGGPERSLSASTDAIGEIRRCESVQRLERQQTQLELDALRNRKSVKTVQQHVFNVIVSLAATQGRRQV